MVDGWMDGDREAKKRKKNTAESPISDQGNIGIHGIWNMACDICPAEHTPAAGSATHNRKVRESSWQQQSIKKT